MESWQTVIVGDPLCAPFPRKALQPSDIDKRIDPATDSAVNADQSFGGPAAGRGCVSSSHRSGR